MRAFSRRKLKCKFYTEWLELDEILNYSPSEKLLEGMSADVDLGEEILREAQQFVNEVTFTERAGYQELLNSEANFSNSQTYTNILEQAGERPGILWRLILAGSRFSDKRDLIHSGLIIRRHLLCENLPSPPADLADEVQNTVDRQLTNMSSRRQVEIKTESSSKNANTKINPIAFANANHYDSLGRFIEESFEITMS